VSRDGRFAALTNFRDPARTRADAPSRGALTRGFLDRMDAAEDYVLEVSAEGNRYNGFGLLLFDGATLAYCSNRSASRILSPGLYGLSNHLLDTPWPKVERGKRLVRACLAGPDVDPESLLGAMQDRAVAADPDLPDPGVGEEVERSDSPIFIETGDYGTRSTTVVLMGIEDDLTLIERTHDRSRAGSGTVTHRLRVGPGRRAAEEWAWASLG
jgi:uncharacterized protein with NRDE domain